MRRFEIFLTNIFRCYFQSFSKLPSLGKVKSPRLLWQSTANPMVPFDGVPFLICGRKVLECQYGPKRDARRRKPDEKGDDIMGKVGEVRVDLLNPQNVPVFS